MLQDKIDELSVALKDTKGLVDALEEKLASVIVPEQPIPVADEAEGPGPGQDISPIERELTDLMGKVLDLSSQIHNLTGRVRI